MRRVIHTTKSFSLVEMVMVIAILGIIAAIGVPLLLSASDTLSFLTVRVDMDQSADTAMSRILSEVRRVRDNISINTATSSQIRFLDRDDTDINYYLNGNNLMRNNTILASSVSALEFIYYDGNGVELDEPTAGIGTATNIKRIEVLLTFQNGSYTFNYQSQVRPRSLQAQW